MNKILKNIKKRLSKFRLNFSLTVLLFISLIFLLVILYIVIYQSSNTNNSDINFNENGAVTDSNGEVIATYTIGEELPNLGIRVVNVLLPDYNEVSGNDLKRLKNGILLSEGLDEDEVYIVFSQISEFDNRISENTLSTGDLFDPYDPSSSIPEDYEDLEDQDLVGLDFGSYVKAVNPRTDNFDIYLQDSGSYLVVLKNGYTDTKFRDEYLSQFSGTDSIVLIFKTKVDLVQ